MTIEPRTVTGTLEALKQRGFTVTFEVVDDTIRARETGQSFAPEALAIREHHRFEGESDPDDMAVVYAIESQDGTRGTLVDAFGVYANPAISAVLKKVRVREGQ
jgi:hypothetical protein